MESYPTFHNEVGVPIVHWLPRVQVRALGIYRRKITHTSTSRWAMPVRSSTPIALRYSASIRAWAAQRWGRRIRNYIALDSKVLGIELAAHIAKIVQLYQSRTNRSSAAATAFLSPHFRFQDLTQYQE